MQPPTPPPVHPHTPPPLLREPGGTLSIHNHTPVARQGQPRRLAFTQVVVSAHANGTVGDGYVCAGDSEANLPGLTKACIIFIAPSFIVGESEMTCISVSSAMALTRGAYTRPLFGST